MRSRQVFRTPSTVFALITPEPMTGIEPASRGWLSPVAVADPAEPNPEGVLCREAGGPGVNVSITTDDLCLDRHGGRVKRAHPTPHLKVHPQHRTVGKPVMPSAHRCAHWSLPSVSLRR